MALFGRKKKQEPDASAVEVAPESASVAADDFAAADLLASAEAAGELEQDIFTDDAVVANNTTAADAIDSGAAGLNGYISDFQHRAAKNGAIVGLNIGSNTIKVVELRAKGGEFTVTGMGMAPTPAESIANGVVMSAGAISHAVRELLSSSGIKTRKAVASVSGTNALVVRVIEVPRMSDAELKDNLAMDADRYIPFPAAEVIMDHQALRELPSDPDAANMDVLLAAAQSEVVDALVKVTQDARLDPQAIDVEPLAAARALFPEDTPDYNDVVGLINMGAAGTEISVLRGNVLVFTRTVPTGGNQITEALVDYLGLSWPDAERLKCESADAMPPTGTTAGSEFGDSFGAASEDTTFESSFEASETMPVAGATVTPTPTAPAPPVAPTTQLSPSAPADAGESDWNDFDLFEGASTEGVTEVETDTSGTATSAPVSQDPFDLDFFDQGPQNTEPPEQHGQKEPEKDKEAESDPLSFDALFEEDEPLPEDVLPAVSSSPAPPLVEPDEDLVDLPAVSTEAAGDANQSTQALGNTATSESTLTPAAAETTPASHFIPSAFDFAFDDDSDDLLPAMADSEESQEAVADFGISSDETDVDDLPAIGEQAAPPADFTLSQDEPTSVVSADASGATPTDPGTADTVEMDGPITFEFAGDDLPEDLPTRGTQPPADETAPLIVGEMGLEDDEAALPAKSEDADAPDFDFNATPDVATPDAADLQASVDALSTSTATPEPKVVRTQSPGESAAGAADFDLDDLFGDDAGVDLLPTSGQAAEKTSFDALSGEADAGEMEFDLESLGAGLADDDTLDVGIDAATLHSIVHPSLESLVGEVRRSLEYHASRSPDAPVRRVVLVGGGAKLKNVDAYFTQALGMPATIGDPLAHVTFNVPRLGEQYAEQNSPVFAVALGLALRELA